jgi:hypothetical protein
MANTRIVIFRVTKSQHERIRNNAQAKGHKTMASYLRDTTLNKDMVFEQRFNEMYDIIVRQKRKD